MSYKISKELFEAVMGFSNVYIFSIEGRNNSKRIDYTFGYTESKTIMINDFFPKCKEWALKQGYNIWSDCMGNITIQDENFDTVDATISNNSEQQAVFDACQWILDKKDKQ